MSETRTIGQVARETGINIETIRFYERRGLIRPPARRASGYRQFAAADIRRLQFIQQAKALGFSLTEISELLSIREDPLTGSREVKTLAETKLKSIEDKIRLLQRMKRALKPLVEQCPGEGSKQDCPILDALEK